jgi:hypothetical protein
MQTLSSAQVERALREVYSQPEFAEQTRGTDLWGWVREQIGVAVMRLFEWLNTFRAMQEARPIVFWLIVAWLSLTAAALLVHLIYTSTSAFTRTRTEHGGREDVPRGPRGATDWESEARRAAAEGRLRDAALALYHALVLRLDARGALRFDPSKTPGDYRREVRAHPEVARPFTAFLRGFEPVAFGGRALDADGYERLRTAAGEAGARG